MRQVLPQVAPVPPAKVMTTAMIMTIADRLKMVAAALLSTAIVAGTAPNTLAQQSFSWCGNQIIENETRRIGARQAYQFIYENMEPCFDRIDVSSAQGQGVSVFLLTEEANAQSERNGRLSNWIKRTSGSNISFVTQVLPIGRYVLRVENYANVAQDVHVRVWAQKP